MRLFLIGLTLATIAAVGLLFGYRLQQQQRADVAELARAEAARAEADAVEAAKSQAPAPTDDTDEGEDEEEAAYRDVMAKRALADNCLVCHEEGMYTSQRLTSAQWKAEVDKMLSWGAVLPEADRAPVEEYLTRHFGSESPVPPPGRVLLADVSTREIPGDPSEGTGEAVVANGAQLYLVVCASCHGPTALGTELGPALADRAILTHAGDYHKIVRDGLRKMPAMNLMLTADQQRDILGWLRSVDHESLAAAASAAKP
ncbi:c-type cytochrome [Planctomyces sp. SH-PL62]|uniref:c-type cytochrome n=1 Tax=Planctomyces sp. SH-PL62 TaxID=1636152 RepID=UPI00078B6662|nr:c-type cytochrome [Planctomyces sp. SH-PL62]AMV38212.1 Cytochrome c [Planctomyces sp. SH-PL62]